MTHTLLVNVGSRSVKLTLISASGDPAALPIQEGCATVSDPASLATLPDDVSLTVHRLVHGGDVVREAVPCTPALMSALEPLDALAPLHNPPARRWLAACMARWPSARHVLVPDSALFHALPEMSRLLPLPQTLCAQQGLHRIGFHGLAHAGLQRALTAEDPLLGEGRVITLQLGGGCSATAWRAGEPVDTTMGFTPLSGLVMASRSGDIDPGVILHLLRQGMDADVLSDLLTQESGLKGLSGLSGDMRVLMASQTPESQRAIHYFCHRLRQTIGALAATLGGLDALVFGGGIGENQPRIRELTCSGLAHLGILLDDTANADAGPSRCISTADSPASAWVLHADEAGEMLRLALPLTESS